MSAYEFSVINADGKSVDLQSYKGHVTLIVNTSRYDQKALQSYELLAQVQQKYKDEDVSVLLFPCSQFGSPETNARVEREFLQNNGLSDAGTLFKEVDVSDEVGGVCNGITYYRDCQSLIALSSSNVV